MARLTFDDIYHVSFSSLGAAADDWKEMVDQLDTLATDAVDGMVKQADAARWAGVNSDVTRPFVRKAAKEIRDAHTEAKGVWSMLRDAHSDLVSVQSDLKKLVDVEAKNKNVRVTGLDDGTVYCVYLHQRGDSDQRTQKQLDYLDDLASRISNLIAKADEIDNSVAGALKKIHGNDSHNFGHAKYDSLDDVQAERAVQLARKSLTKYKHGEELSTKELTELKQLLSDNAKDREFTVDFYKALGPKDALRFEAQIAIDASAEGDKTQLKLAHSIQTSMGVALATATDPPSGKDNPDTAFRENKDYLGKAWQSELKRVGRNKLELGIGFDHAEPVGYQALSSLLRHGNYDKSFLVPVAEDMVTIERKGGGWPIPDQFNGENDFGLNLDKKGGPGWDPMTGVLEAFGHSPEASTAFFNGSTGEGAHDDLKKLSNLDYFLGDKDGENGREWPSDKTSGYILPDEKSKTYGKDALGHALESATTGRAYDSDGPSVKHTQERADLFTTIVDKLGANPGLIKTDGELAPIADSLGNMSAEYMHDIQRSIAGGDESGYIGHFGADAYLQDVEKGHLKQFLRATAWDPDAYASITHASQAVTTEMMRDALADPGGEPPASVAARATTPGSTIAGITAVGQADAIAAADDSVEKINQYNEKLETGNKWVSRIVEMGVGKIPVAGDAVGWVAEDIQESVVSHYTKDPTEAAQQITENREDYLDGEREETGQSMKQAARTAAQQAGLPDGKISGVVDDVYSASNVAFSDGKAR
ncbi:DUF6571 family protein [Streptomyces rugosispiralis]|uniref:AG2 protein n=1 Tax=Streptomyces rugosispiralis TaxID=2967341 RepID=A0ABT1VB19_9ACTN|nr:DUF6571 family protein [Streptomyces rugosispiralis]MCQ8194592.1 hypothetical protein [Streptomyces rugosispiralis]